MISNAGIFTTFFSLTTSSRRKKKKKEEDEGEQGEEELKLYGLSTGETSTSKQFYAFQVDG